MSKPLALVTGGNRGVGLETARQLVGKGYHVLIGARDAVGATEAEETIRKEVAGASVGSVLIDVSSSGGIDAAVADLTRRFGEKSLSVLVNNAGVLFPEWNADVFKTMMATNYHGTVELALKALPVLKDGGSIVQVSSESGQVATQSEENQTRIPSLKTLDEVAAVASTYRADDPQGALQFGAYRLSKALLNHATKLLSVDPRLTSRGITINSVCPGWVRTRMGGDSAPRSVEQGGSSVAWVAASIPAGSTGGFYRDGEALAF